MAFSGGLFLAIFAAFWMVSGPTMFAHLGDAAPLFGGIAVACAVVGWFSQEVGRACGLRLSGRFKPEGAADYDDHPPSPHTP
jgi:hypothetical protein